MRVVVLGAALLLAAGWRGEAQADGGPVSVTPGSGACTDALSVHADGLTANAEVFLFAGTADGAGRELVTFDWPTGTSWDFAMPKGVRYLCDEFANPAMVVSLWSALDTTGSPVGLIGAATFTRTKPDAVPAGPVIRVTPERGECTTPLHVEGSGFPPNEPVELELAPLITLPGSGGAGLAIPGGTTGADGSYESDALSVNDGTGKPAAYVAQTVGAVECRKTARLRILVSPARASDGSRSAFVPAETVFRRTDVTAPAAGSGVRRSRPAGARSLAGMVAVVGAFLALGTWTTGRLARRR